MMNVSVNHGPEMQAEARSVVVAQPSPVIAAKPGLIPSLWLLCLNNEARHKHLAAVLFFFVFLFNDTLVMLCRPTFAASFQVTF